MPSPNWCVTDLAAPDALVLTIGGYEFPVVQFVSSFAVNEIPTCTCMIAVGRDARSAGAGTPSPAHDALAELLPLEGATVTFRPLGNATPWAAWTGDAEVVFDGYYVGCGQRVSRGQALLPVYLTHWLAALGFSSSLNADSNSANPAWLTDACVRRVDGTPADDPEARALSGGGLEPAYLHQHVDAKVEGSDVENDLWAGVKDLLCKVARRNRMEPTCAAACGLKFRDNTPALAALARMEDGGSGLCKAGSSLYHVPLKLARANGVPEVLESVAEVLKSQTLESWAGATMWDVLVGEICPAFNLAVIPRVSTALVVADTPAYRTARKTVEVTEQDGYDFQGVTARPLGAVGVAAGFYTVTGASETQKDGRDTRTCGGGCYTPDAGDTAVPGAALYVAAPRWLNNLPAVQPVKPGEAVLPTATAPGRVGQGGGTPGYDATLRALYGDYARAVYTAQALRGRTGPFSGRLRFDICPGTIVRVRSRSEQFLGGYDALAADVYGSVNRVTVAVNADAGSAGTNFQLTHLRTEFENRSDRLSTAEHPLYGAGVFNGAPLVDNWDF